MRMSNTAAMHTIARKTPWERMKKWFRILWQQRALVALCLIPLAVVVLFQYVPMYGVLIAFKKYKPKKGVWGSAWLDPWYKNFQEFFNNVNCEHIILQTIKVGVLSLIFTYPMPIILALMLNEVRSKWFKRSVQTISYLPHFISIVVICSMLNTFGSLDGLFNNVRVLFGLDRVNMNAGTAYFMPMFIGSAIWQGVGWGSIIYLSALSNVDTSLYDVANIDGANRFQKIQHICLPAILPTTTVVLILNTGNIFTQDYTKILLMMNETNRMDLEVISTYVYRMGIQDGRFEFATAVNLFVSLVSLILVVGTNYVVRFIDPEQSIW